MDKDTRAEALAKELLSSTYASATITKDGKVYELRSLIRSIEIRDMSCNCVSIADSPRNVIDSIKELI